MNIRTKRICNEMKNFWIDPPEGCSAEFIGDDIINWRVYIIGPPDSRYEGGTFIPRIHFPESYPHEPPKIQFETPIYHPNVRFFESFIFEWFAGASVETILVSIRSLLSEPNFICPTNTDIAEIYKEDREKFNKIAKEWCQSHAM